MKTINQVIEEKRKEFDELIGDVPQHAKYVIDKYTKDSCCVMCGHPAQPSVVVNKITSFIFTDYTTSLLKAVEEMCEKELQTYEGDDRLTLIWNNIKDSLKRS